MILTTRCKSVQAGVNFTAWSLNAVQMNKIQSLELDLKKHMCQNEKCNHSTRLPTKLEWAGPLSE